MFSRNKLYCVFLPGYCVCGVYPAVEVEHVVWHIFGVDAVDRVPNVLTGCHNDGEC